jgi:hypothetical protein
MANVKVRSAMYEIGNVWRNGLALLLTIRCFNKKAGSVGSSFARRLISLGLEIMQYADSRVVIWAVLYGYSNGSLD